LALRSRIVLGCADGLANKEVADREGVSQPTVGWRLKPYRDEASLVSLNPFQPGDGEVGGYGAVSLK